MNDNGLNDYVLGCSDEELQAFLKNLDKLPATHLRLLISVLSYDSKERLQIIDLTNILQTSHKF
jgi:hypothetical protein